MHIDGLIVLYKRKETSIFGGELTYVYRVLLQSFDEARAFIERRYQDDIVNLPLKVSLTTDWIDSTFVIKSGDIEIARYDAISIWKPSDNMYGSER